MAGFSLDMAINRTNVGRQMVGDLGNFVGTDLRKQFMFGPQKLAYGPQKFAEGETVAEEITFETVSFTDDITGKTKTFKYNPETHHPPDSTGRMRKKGVNTSDVATQGGVNFFDAAEVVEEEAAPASAAAPRREKPPVPFNPETDADREELETQRDQLFNPLEHSYASPKGALMDYKISKYTDPLVRIASRGMINPDIDDRLRRYMGEKPDRYVRSYEGRPEDYGKLVLDPRDKTLGLDKKTIDKELAEQRKFSGLKDDERFKDDQVKDLLWRARERNLNPMWRRQIEKGGMKTSDSGDPVEKSSDTSDKPSDTSGGLSAALKAKGESPLVTGLERPEKEGLTSALKGPSPAKTLAQDLTASITPVTTENLPSITPRAKLQADADKEAAQTKKEEEEAAAIKKAQSKLDPKTIKALKAMEKSANLLSIAKKRFDTGEGSLTKKEERGYRTSRDRLFPSMSQLSPEAYETEYSVSKYMPTREEMNKYEAFRAADDRIDWSEEGETDDFAGTIDTGSPFRQGGPVRLAGGGGLSSLNPPINPGDFVIASDVVSGIGDGSSQFGVERLTDELGVQPRPFSAALGGEVRGPGSGLDDLIQTSVRGKQAARLANQEFVVPRQDVMKIGKGNLKNGQEMLYALMDRVRKQKSGGQQPPRLQGSLAGLMGNMRS